MLHSYEFDYLSAFNEQSYTRPFVGLFQLNLSTVAVQLQRLQTAVVTGCPRSEAQHQSKNFNAHVAWTELVSCPCLPSRSRTADIVAAGSSP